MPNIKSAKKRVLVAKKKEEQNKVVKSSMRNAVKQAKAAISGNTDNKEELMVRAISSIDKAAKKNILHKANADRKKSRLQKMMNK